MKTLMTLSVLSATMIFAQAHANPELPTSTVAQVQLLGTNHAPSGTGIALVKDLESGVIYAIREGSPVLSLGILIRVTTQTVTILARDGTLLTLTRPGGRTPADVHTLASL